MLTHLKLPLNDIVYKYLDFISNNKLPYYKLFDLTPLDLETLIENL